MILRKRKRFYRLSLRLRFISLCLVTTISIFFLSSELPVGMLLAQTAPCTTGFLCQATNKIVSTTPFDQNADLIRAIFLGINALIGAAIAWRAYKVWIARESGEEYQTIITSSVIGVIGLLLFESLINFVIGA